MYICTSKSISTEQGNEYIPPHYLCFFYTFLYILIWVLLLSNIILFPNNTSIIVYILGTVCEILMHIHNVWG